MSRGGDNKRSMRRRVRFDDATADAVVGGHHFGREELTGVVAFVDDVRAMSHRAAPPPSAALAALFADGAVVPLPVAKPHRSGRARVGPWTKAALVGFVGVGSVAVAGAAGALPAPAQHLVAEVIRTLTPFSIPDPERDAVVKSAIAEPATPVADAVGSSFVGGSSTPRVPVGLSVPGAVLPTGSTPVSAQPSAGDRSASHAGGMSTGGHDATPPGATLPARSDDADPPSALSTPSAPSAPSAPSTPPAPPAPPPKGASSPVRQGPSDANPVKRSSRAVSTAATAPGRLSPAKHTAPGMVSPSDTPPNHGSPSDTAPGKVSPAKHTAPGKVSETAPGKSNPSDMAPGKSDPSDMGPGRVSPSDTAPGRVSPSDTAPGKSNPSDMGPGRVSPSDTAPGTVSPSDTAPGTSPNGKPNGKPNGTAPVKAR